jgi:hypothetical protein
MGMPESLSERGHFFPERSKDCRKNGGCDSGQSEYACRNGGFPQYDCHRDADALAEFDDFDDRFNSVDSDTDANNYIDVIDAVDSDANADNHIDVIDTVNSDTNANNYIDVIDAVDSDADPDNHMDSYDAVDAYADTDIKLYHQHSELCLVMAENIVEF